MVRARALAAACALALLAAATSPAAADYRFEVERNASLVTIQRDGSVDLQYELRFRCLPGGKPIDIVDIGLPNRHYRLETASAQINGVPAPIIRRSQVLKVGVEIPLPLPIAPGASGTIHFRVNNPRMVYQDRDDPDYAGIEFSPTWYGAAYARGATDLSVTIVFPEGVTGQETRYHRERFDDARTVDGGIAFTWLRPGASPSRQYQFGVSFPRRYVEVVHRESALGAAARRLLTPGVIAAFGLACLALAGLLLHAANERRKTDYLPPSLTMEGNGVRRGLTAVEAAVLLEQPLDRVAAMIFFGLAQKGALRVHSWDPLRAEPTGAPPAELHPWEKDLLALIGPRLVGEVPAADMRNLMTDLVRQVNDKLRGYCRRETAEYYRYIVSRAWLEVAAAQTPQERVERWERNADWTMADGQFPQRMEDNFGPEQGLPRRGRWWDDDLSGWQVEGRGPQGPLDLPGREFAQRVVSRIEGLARGLVSRRAELMRAVTEKTNPPTLVPELKRMLAQLGEGSGRGCVGGGCACACACASCACACAGGGR